MLLNGFTIAMETCTYCGEILFEMLNEITRQQICTIETNQISQFVLGIVKCTLLNGCVCSIVGNLQLGFRLSLVLFL